MPSGVQNYKKGSVVEIKAHPNEGFKFVSWTGNANVTDANEAFTTIVIEKNTTLYADFAEVVNKTVTLSSKASHGGAVYPAGENNYEEGDSVTITANAEEGWEFSHWEGDVFNLTTKVINVKMTENKSILAVFKKKTFTLTVTSNDSNKGSVNLEGTTVYNYNDTISIEAFPKKDFIFKFWDGDKYSVENPFTFDVTQDLHIVANFEIGNIDVPQNLKSSEGEFGNKIEINWDPCNVETYKIHRIKFEGGNGKTFYSPNNFFHDSEIVPGQKYIYKISGVKYGKESEFSNESIGWASLSKPLLNSPEGFTTIYRSIPKLTLFKWEDVEGAAQYKFRLYKNMSKLIVSETFSSNSIRINLTLDSFGVGENYKWTVSPIDKYGKMYRHSASYFDIEE